MKSCDDRLLITELDLNSNNLVGRIPIELTYVRMLGNEIFYEFS